MAYIGIPSNADLGRKALNSPMALFYLPMLKKYMMLLDGRRNTTRATKLPTTFLFNNVNKPISNGAKWCKMVQNGAKWCKMLFTKLITLF
jgi:hypothetical protein